MQQQRRRVTYRMYPTSGQERELERVCELHRVLYNAALQERIDAYRLRGKSISFSNQCKSITEIRRSDVEYAKLNAQSTQVTLKRLDEAFSHFFRRVKVGETPGFPRFKSKDRFPGFGYKTHGDGFKFIPGVNWKHGTLRLSGIGDIRVRGSARTPGQPICCAIMRKADGWYLSLVAACDPYRERVSDFECGMDWGTETYLTLAYDDGQGVGFAAYDNERFLRSGAADVLNAQRALSRALRGKRSKTAAKKRKLLARRMRKIANRRKNRVHQVTAELVKRHSLIVTEELNIPNMTGSAEGSVEEPGKQVAQKAGLNKSILDTAPGMTLSMLDYKAEEADSRVMYLNTRKWKPSQTCPECGCIRKKSLSERMHICEDCGFVATRDQAAALVMLRAGRRDLSREPVQVVSLPETPPRGAQRHRRGSSSQRGCHRRRTLKRR